MTYSQIAEYQNCTIKMKYINKKGHLNTQTGIITAISVKRVSFLILDDSEDLEIAIPFERIKSIDKINGTE